MDQRLVEAARVGDVNALKRLLEDDPHIPMRASLTHFAETPLHVAALADKVDFVKQIIKQMPSLVTETNQNGLIPLHMACATGHVTIVKELLKVNNKPHDDDNVNQCLLKDDDGWTPLHYAAFRGRVDVIEEIIRYCPDCVEEVTVQGETVLHLAVKANQLGAVKVIVERIKSLPNFQTLSVAKNNEGKTIYDLAAANKQFKAILDMGKKDKKDDKKEETSITVEVKDKEGEEAATEDKVDRSNGFDNAVLVVATLIVTLTYQGLVNPPSTLFKQGTDEINWECILNFFGTEHNHHGLIDYMKNCPAFLGSLFLFSNTLTFLQSIYLVVSTLQTRRSLSMRLLVLYFHNELQHLTDGFLQLYCIFCCSSHNFDSHAYA